MQKAKKLSLVTAIGLAGVLLSLAGFHLIELSANLTKYAGLALLIITFLIYFLY